MNKGQLKEERLDPCWIRARSRKTCCLENRVLIHIKHAFAVIFKKKKKPCKT